MTAGRVPGCFLRYSPRVPMPGLRLWRPPAVLRTANAVVRTFASSSLRPAKQLPPRRVISDAEIEENFLKGSGPGGQKINKTSSAVQLKHLPTGIVVKCQDTRSRSQNRKLARRLLGERLEELELGEESRTAIKGREKSRKKASADKKKRRKYRLLAEKAGEGDGAEGGGEVGEARADTGDASQTGKEG